MLKLVFGQETLLSKRFLSQLKDELASTHSVSPVDCSKEDFEVLRGIIASPSLFSTKQLLLFLNPFSSPTFLAKLEEDTAILENKENAFVFFQEGEAKKGSPLYRFVKKTGEIHEFPKLSLAESLEFVKKEAERYGVEMSKEVCQELVRRAANDLWRLAKEVQKLAAFQGKARRKLTAQDVALLVQEEAESEIFAMLDQLARKDRKKATDLLVRHLARGQAPLHLFSMLVYQLRLLLLVKDLEERTTPFQDMAKILGAHPYAVKKAVEAARNFSLEELKDLYKRAFSLEVAFKTGRGDAEQLLTIFLGQAAGKKKPAL